MHAAEEGSEVKQGNSVAIRASIPTTPVHTTSYNTIEPYCLFLVAVHHFQNTTKAFY
jgi:hypothetical protein